MKKKRIPAEHLALKVFEYFGDWNTGEFNQVNNPFLSAVAAGINPMLP